MPYTKENEYYAVISCLHGTKNDQGAMEGGNKTKTNVLPKQMMLFQTKME